MPTMPISRSTVALVATLVLLAGALAVAGQAWRKAGEATAAAARHAEEARLAQADLVVSRQDAQHLRDHADELVAGDAGLRAELGRWKAAAGRLQIVLAEVLRTKPLPSAPQAQPRPPEPAGSPQPPCLFAAGDVGEVRVRELHLATEAGSRGVVATLECARLRPGPETILFSGPAEASLSAVSTVGPPASPPGWGGGLYGACVGPACALGGLVALPPWRVPLLGGQLELSAGAGGGPGGLSGLATVVYRR